MDATGFGAFPRSPAFEGRFAGHPPCVAIVYFFVAAHCSTPDFCCQVSVERLAELSGLSDRSVRRGLSILKRAKLLQVKAADGKVNSYRLHCRTPVSAVTPDASVTPDSTVTPDSVVSGTPDTTGRTPDTPDRGTPDKRAPLSGIKERVVINNNASRNGDAYLIEQECRRLNYTDQEAALLAAKYPRYSKEYILERAVAAKERIRQDLDDGRIRPGGHTAYGLADHQIAQNYVVSRRPQKQAEPMPNVPPEAEQKIQRRRRKQETVTRQRMAKVLTALPAERQKELVEEAIRQSTWGNITNRSVTNQMIMSACYRIHMEGAHKLGDVLADQVGSLSP